MGQHRLNRLKGTKATTVPIGMHCDGGGLYLQVKAGNGRKLTRSWIFRYAIGTTAISKSGKPRKVERQMGLGSLDVVSLAAARERASECRRMLHAGTDPFEAQRRIQTSKRLAASRSMTFKECADQYLTAHETSWRNAKHRAQWRSTLITYVDPMLGDLPVADIDTALVIKVLQPLWQLKPETASRVRGRIERVLIWATVREFREGDNPARWRGHLDQLLPRRSKVQKVKHHAAMPYAEMPAFLTRLRQQGGAAARLLEFTILTAARTGETRRATVGEIDMAEKAWTISAERMKGGREHRVPLSDRAIAILPSVDRGKSQVLFPGLRGVVSDTGMLRVLERIGHGNLTVHGFRSTFRDWAAERTNFPNEVVEMALAHIVANKVEAAYRRGDLFDKRRRLMEAWAEYCVREQPTADVVPLRA
jgi:integrase